MVTIDEVKLYISYKLAKVESAIEAEKFYNNSSIVLYALNNEKMAYQDVLDVIEGKK